MQLVDVNDTCLAGIQVDDGIITVPRQWFYLYRNIG